VGVAGGAAVSGDHDDGAHGTVFGDETGCVAAMTVLVSLISHG
jgi:hypothetical protein